MENKTKEELLQTACSGLNIQLTDTQTRQLLLFYDHLYKKNQVMNLTAITDYQEVVEKHFLDSLSLVKIVDLQNSKDLRLLDLGTGAGFPGLPLKIVFPQLSVTLVDSLQKRIRFLQEVIDICGLKEIEAIHGRAEELARKEEYREQYDLCVSRAVANLSTLSEYCLPFVKIGGAFISYKGGNVGEELTQAKKAITSLGGNIPDPPDVFTLPGTDLQRTLVKIKKSRPTPGKYPRKAGTPLKEPVI